MKLLKLIILLQLIFVCDLAAQNNNLVANFIGKKKIENFNVKIEAGKVLSQSQQDYFDQIQFIHKKIELKINDDESKYIIQNFHSNKSLFTNELTLIDNFLFEKIEGQKKKIDIQKHFYIDSVIEYNVFKKINNYNCTLYKSSNDTNYTYWVAKDLPTSITPLIRLVNVNGAILSANSPIFEFKLVELNTTNEINKPKQIKIEILKKDKSELEKYINGNNLAFVTFSHYKCIPCIEEIGMINSLYDSVSKYSIKFLCFTPDNKEQNSIFRKTHKLKPSLIDDIFTTKRLYENSFFEFYPTSVLIYKDTIIFKRQGKLLNSDLVEIIELVKNKVID